MFECIACELPVTSRQQGLQCDGCQRWQHRRCNTGVTQAEYRAAVRDRRDIDWVCAACPRQGPDPVPEPQPAHEPVPVRDLVINPEDGPIPPGHHRWPANPASTCYC